MGKLRDGAEIYEVGDIPRQSEVLQGTTGLIALTS